MPKHLRAIWRPPTDTARQAPVGTLNGPHPFVQTETHPRANVPEGTGIGKGRQTLPTTGSLKHTLLLAVLMDTQVAL
jgi:hypothetical protein